MPPVTPPGRAAVPPQAHGVASPQGGHPAWPGPPMPPPQQPSPYGWPGPPAPPAVIDVGKSSGRKLVIGSIVAGALGLISICAGLTGAVEGGPGTAIATIAIGSVCLLIGLLPVFFYKMAFRPRRLVIEQQGIRWDDPRGKPWAVQWRELAAVSISKHGALQVGPESVSDKVSGAIVDRVTGERVMVRLDLFPADPGFHQRHPEMAHLWAQDRYRLPFGQSPGLIPQIEAPMRHFQPMLYRGVQETEGFMGLT
jgi:hypothetical protein